MNWLQFLSQIHLKHFSIDKWYTKWVDFNFTKMRWTEWNCVLRQPLFWFLILSRHTSLSFWTGRMKSYITILHKTISYTDSNAMRPVLCQEDYYLEMNNSWNRFRSSWKLLSILSEVVFSLYWIFTVLLLDSVLWDERHLSNRLCYELLAEPTFCHFSPGVGTLFPLCLFFIRQVSFHLSCPSLSHILSFCFSLFLSLALFMLLMCLALFIFILVFLLHCATTVHLWMSGPEEETELCHMWIPCFLFCFFSSVILRD